MSRLPWAVVVVSLVGVMGCGGVTPASTQVTCGTGTTLAGEACVADVTCGTGTTVSNGQCVAAPSLTCGAGTVQANTQCVAVLAPVLTCGAGTVELNGQCVVSGTPLTCGAGTTAVSGKCVVNTTLVCGTDTSVANGGTTCVGRVSCGSGTTRTVDTCVVNPTGLCGSGTSWSGTQCVLTPVNPSFATFTAQASLVTSFFDRDNSTTSNNLHSYRFVATDLTQGVADGWTQVTGAMVGTGSAVHARWNHNTSADLSLTAQTIAVRDASDGAGHCLSSLQPYTEPSSNIDGTYVNYFAWSGAVATPVACGVAGTVTFVREQTVPQRVRMTFNVQFSDGTAWINKTLYADYRK